MRLLNTHTLRLEDFWDERSAPRYAILSHTWGDEEVQYRDLTQGDSPANQRGWAKLQFGCAQALEDGLRYLWVDTCCIDKSSSAELSEAINSMYRWYQEADVCYAYLVDVVSQAEDSDQTNRAFRRSRWFTRGWTLQELLAPRNVRFYDKNWSHIAERSEVSGQLAKATDISEAILRGKLSMTEVDIATKLSWASKRQTARIEDGAYALMGLLGVYMPPIYGEGRNAYRRLYRELTRSHDVKPELARYFSRCLDDDAPRLPAALSDSDGAKLPLSRAVDLHGSASPKPSTGSHRSCAQCHQRFSTSHALHEHVCATACRAYRCKESGCHTSFSRPTSLARHVKMHRQPEQHKCGTCGREFARKDNCNRHEAKCAPSVPSAWKAERTFKPCDRPPFDFAQDFALFDADVITACEPEDVPSETSLLPVPETTIPFARAPESSKIGPWRLPASGEDLWHSENGGEHLNQAGRSRHHDQRGIDDDSSFPGIRLLSDIMSSAPWTPLEAVSHSSNTVALRPAVPRSNPQPGHQLLPSIWAWNAVNGSAHSAMRISRNAPTAPSTASSRSSRSKRERVSCPTCSSDFTRPRDLQRHMASQHYNEKRYSCSTCGYESPRKDKMMEHCRKSHGQMRGCEAFINPYGSLYVDTVDADDRLCGP